MANQHDNINCPADAEEAIAKKLAQAQALLSECENIADEHMVEFYFSLGGIAGGYYQGDPEARYDRDYGWTSSGY